MSVSVCTLCIQKSSETSEEDIGALRTAAECCELSDVGVGNQTLILYKCSKVFSHRAPIPAHLFSILKSLY